MLKNVWFPLFDTDRFEAAVLSAPAIVELVDVVVGSANATSKIFGACQPDAVI
jgi:hypothetical protein